MNENTQSFEESMQCLEQIVRLMERGEVPLEESLQLFQEGTELIGRCGKMLDNAELQVKKVLASSGGEPIEESFTHEF